MSRRMKDPDAEAGNVEGLPIYQRLIAPDLPRRISRVHVHGCSRLPTNELEGVHVVGVSVRHEDSRDRGTGRGQDLLWFGPRVDDDVAIGRVNDEGVNVEAVH